MKGGLKIYLGYAAGVGKTFRMLEEAQAARRQGADIVIAYFEPHGRKETIDRTEGLEVVPRRAITYGGARFEDMDVDAVLRRHPAIAIVDEFAHTNVPGSERSKRWQDVHLLLGAGIGVWTTMNVQHLESLNDQVWHTTGVRVRETVPDWVVDEADEVVLIDLTTGALRNRLLRGVVYPVEKAQRAMDNFFTEGNLSALREMALRHTAHEVEERLRPQAPAGAPAPVGKPERLLLCLTAEPASAVLIRRGKQVADYIHAACLALYVRTGGEEASPSVEAVDRHLRFARNLRIETHIVEAADAALAIAEFARAHGITQIFVGRPGPRRWWRRFQENTVQKLVRQARDMQITIVAERRR